MAVALDGSVLANVALLDGADEAESAIRGAMALGGRVFVGVELREGEVTEMRRWLHDAAYEGLAFVLGARRKRRRGSRSRKPRRGGV